MNQRLEQMPVGWVDVKRARGTRKLLREEWIIPAKKTHKKNILLHTIFTKLPEINSQVPLFFNVWCRVDFMPPE